MIVGVVYRLRTDTTKTFMKYVIFVGKCYAIVIWKIRCINKKKKHSFSLRFKPLDYFWFIWLRKDSVFLSLQRAVSEILLIRAKRIVKLHNKSNYLVNTDLVKYSFVKRSWSTKITHKYLTFELVIRVKKIKDRHCFIKTILLTSPNWQRQNKQMKLQQG